MKQFFIGIDFGHGETSVSRVPGVNGQPVSRIPLSRSSNFAEQKVITALCRDENGGWKFVKSAEDFCRPDVQEGFKGIIHNLDSGKKNALREFAKLVFKSILENDSELKYNPKTGESNFVICIANPTDWRRQDAKIPDEYRNFFVKEAGVPAQFCINESDAAFYSQFTKYSPSDTVFVIDLGSSTIDFTTYHNSEIIPTCCWGANKGAHEVEDKLVEFGYSEAPDSEENKETIQEVEIIRKQGGLGTANAAVSLLARMEKESFFTNSQHTYSLEIKTFRLIPNYPDRRKTAFYVEIDQSQVLEIIHDYVSSLDLALKNAADKLKSQGISPTKILISGGASRMPFVLDLVRKAFSKKDSERDIEIYLDQYPEWVVSDGAALYAAKHNKALEERDRLQNEFSEWAAENLDDKLQSVAVSTFNSILKEELQSGLEAKFLNGSDGSLNALESAAEEILCGVTQTYNFKSTANSRFTAVIDDFIKEKLENIIYKNYGKKVTINENFINPGDTFENVGVNTESLHGIIEDIADDVCNNFMESKSDLRWDRARDYEKRHQLMNAYIDKCDYKYFNHNIDLNKFIEEAVGKIDRILHDNGLFQISE